MRFPVEKTRSKYGSVKTELDGITFDSKAEAKRYAELKILARGGLISDLKLQPKFPLEVNGLVVATYIADFSYRAGTQGLVIEDVKSEATKTPVYNLKKKLMKALHGIEIVEVSRS
jgi:hypothetical protein